MEFDEITHTFNRTKSVVRHVGNRTVRVAVIPDDRPEPVVLGNSSVQQAERFGELMEESGFSAIEVPHRGGQNPFDLLFVRAGQVCSVLSRL